MSVAFIFGHLDKIYMKISLGHGQIITRYIHHEGQMLSSVPDFWQLVLTDLKGLQ